jgi:hypothetical protein
LQQSNVMGLHGQEAHDAGDNNDDDNLNSPETSF